MGFQVWDLWCRVQGSGFRVQGSGFRFSAWGFVFRRKCFGFRVHSGLVFRV
jgi:hypothetical protein